MGNVVEMRLEQEMWMKDMWKDFGSTEENEQESVVDDMAPIMDARAGA